MERGEAGQLAAEPLGEAECLEGPVGWVRESAGEQPNPTTAILDENPLADVMGTKVLSDAYKIGRTETESGTPRPSTIAKS